MSCTYSSTQDRSFKWPPVDFEDFRACGLPRILTIFALKFIRQTIEIDARSAQTEINYFNFIRTLIKK